MEKNQQVCESREDEHIGTCGVSRTYKRPTGCGSLYMHVIYKPDNRIDYFLLEGDKDNYCGDSHLATHADNLTFMVRRIRNEHEAQAIIKNYRFHACNKCPINSHKTKSCSDAIGQMLEEVLKRD
jgi:hypothetical protein